MIDFAALLAEARDDSAAQAGLVAQVRELQEGYAKLRLERDQLAARALRDPLTDALSRSVFYEELSRALLRLRRRPRPLAVLFVDVDRLKQVNDAHGHAAGDELLRVTVERLRASVRPSDAVARIGGDEFVVLLDDLSSEAEAEGVAARVLRNLCLPCPVASGVVLRPSASIGLALASPDVSEADVLLSHADAAMYKAKQRGRCRYALFDAAAYSAAAARRQLEGELRRAIPAGQLALHYQPIFHLATGRRHAVEALLRWRHPGMGLLTADTFIDVADDSGLLAELSPWVITEACAQLARWDQALDERAPERMFLNLSVSELIQPDLHSLVGSALTDTGVDASRLVIEVTESGMLDKPGSVAEAVDRLLELGCSVAIDDFGTGYSALSRLVELPADILKIDRAFVQRLGSGQEAAAIIAAVLLLAHNLRKTVVAEGIENPQALATLTELGCEQGQGFYLGRPAPAATITRASPRRELALA
jgi:diguanylate cyclase (GGDEF)-like protein